MTVLVAIAVSILPAPAVQADDAPWVLMNDSGLIVDKFGTSETVFVTGSAVGGSGLIPAVDIYVVNHLTWTPSDGSSLAGLDVTNPSHTPNTAVGFEVIDLPIWIPYLAAGSYDLVIDKNQNGHYDADLDDVLGTADRPGFTVTFDGNSRNIDKQALKEAFAAPWKHAAAQADLISSAVQTFQVADSVQGALSWAEGALVLKSTRTSILSMNCFDIQCTTFDKAAYLATDPGGIGIEGVSTLWNASPDPTNHIPSGAALCTETLKIQPPFSCRIPSDPTAAFSSTDFGSAQIELAAKNLNLAVEGIYADPPDPNYRGVFAYQPAQTVFAPVSMASPAPEQAELANWMNVAAGHSRALLHAIERFDGAAAASDDEWVRKQAAAINDESVQLIDSLNNVRTQARATAAAMRAAGASMTVPDRTAFAALQTRLSETGLNQTEADSLHAADWTDTDIEELRSDLTAIPIGDTPGDMAGVLETLPSLAPDGDTALWSLANYAGSIASTQVPTQDPVAAFTSSRVPTTANSIAFDASGSTGDQITSYAWDFGDSGSGSGATATHTYPQSGSYQVTLTVTDANNRTATITDQVQAQQEPPIASFTATPDSGLSPLAVSLDATASTDPDGSLTAFAWTFDDDTSSSGPTLTHTFSSPGTHQITLTVTDDNGATTQATKAVTVSTPGQNQPPVGVFSVTPDHGSAPLNASFDATASTDPDGTLAAYSWDFGDGATGDGPTISHTYITPGTFTITLTVTDNAGQSSAVTSAVTVQAPTNGPPAPVDDSLTVVGSGVIDVLGNDIEPNGDPLTLTETDKAVHGSVTCSELGACLYIALDDYTGADSFTYKVTDPAGSTATAQVTVSVGPTNGGGAAPTAADDQVSTTFDTPVRVEPLTNDQGTSALSLQKTSDPAHGAATCSTDGICTYSPSSGFAGSDGFSYTATDESGQSATAGVQITVSPETAAFTTTVSGRPVNPLLTGTAMPQGDNAFWTVATAASSGLSVDQAGALGQATGHISLTGEHALDELSITTAPGWTVAVSNGGLDYRSGIGALIGTSANIPIPRPQPAISQGTGGDGHVPIIVGNRVFAFFHHSHPTSVTCVDRATGMLCPGYPKQLNLGTGNIPGPAAVVGTHIYTHLLPENGTASDPISLFCWDVSTGRTCGLITVDRTTSSLSGASAPVLVGGKIYLAGGTGKLYCVNPTTNTPCSTSSVPLGFTAPDLPAGLAEFDIVAHGTRIFVSVSASNATVCIDANSGKPCAGWSGPKDLGGWDLVNQHAADGAVVGVCAVAGSNGTCVPDDNPSATSTLSGWPAGDGYYGVTQEAETGSRTFVASLNRGGLGCWDWASAAPCSGGSFASDGWLSLDTKGDALYSAYGAAFDGSCVIGLGDPGQVFTVDPNGFAPCTSLGTGTAARSVDLRSQRCDGTVGAARWTRVGLSDSEDGSELDSAVVTVSDAATGEVLSRGELVGTNGGDLSSIDPVKHPALTLQGTARGNSTADAWADSVPPKIQLSWHADATTICLQTSTSIDCARADGPVGLEVAGAGPTASATVTVTKPPTCQPVNSRPTAQALALTTPANKPISATLNATDPDGDNVSYAVATNPSHGTLSGIPPNLTYSPNTGYTGPDSFTYTASDSGGSSAPATVDINVTTPDCGSTAPSLVASVSNDRRTPVWALRAPALSAAAGDLVLAFVAADGPQAPTQKVKNVTGGNLNWTLAVRSNDTWGTTEIWQASATSAVDSFNVTASLAKQFDGSITVATFRGAGNKVGAVSAASGKSGTPKASLQAGCQSLVWSTGHDWSRASVITAPKAKRCSTTGETHAPTTATGCNRPTRQLRLAKSN